MFLQNAFFMSSRAYTLCHPARPLCHFELVEKSPCHLDQRGEISPCASLSRDDKKRVVEMTLGDGAGDDIVSK